jgi:predicted phosphodiesterase
VSWLRSPEAARVLGVSSRTVRDRAALDPSHPRHIESRPADNGREYWVEDARPTAGLRAEAMSSDDEGAMAQLIAMASPAHRQAPPDRQERTTDGVRQVAWISDVHFPEEDPRVWRGFVDFCADLQPAEIILGGDILELESCSSHGGVARPAHLIEEITYARARLDELQAAAPSSKITFLEGNHEDRLNRIVVNMLPTLDGALDLPSLLQLKERGIAWHKFGHVVRRGSVAFVHGWWSPQHHAAKMLRELGESVVYGHTHRSQMFCKGGPRGPRAAYGMPCARDLDAPWMKGRPSGWTQGWGLVELDDAGRYQVHVIHAVDGRAIFAGRRYPAEDA